VAKKVEQTQIKDWDEKSVKKVGTKNCGENGSLEKKTFQSHFFAERFKHCKTLLGNMTRKYLYQHFRICICIDILELVIVSTFQNVYLYRHFRICNCIDKQVFVFFCCHHFPDRKSHKRGTTIRTDLAFCFMPGA
jgi:hypothetical protein